ncbi:unnamed protein product, partial [Polarella glacialis]
LVALQLLGILATAWLIPYAASVATVSWPSESPMATSPGPSPPPPGLLSEADPPGLSILGVHSRRLEFQDGTSLALLLGLLMALRVWLQLIEAVVRLLVAEVIARWYYSHA